MRYVAAFRTYTWGEGEAEMARRFFRACPSARQVVLADETRGPLGIPDYEVISHTDDLTALGLPDYPQGRSLWFNVDYGLYVLREAIPDYDYYVTSESDLAVNLDLEPVLQQIAERETDFVGSHVMISRSNWRWYENARGAFEKPVHVLLCFMILSARAIDRLLAARRHHADELQRGTLAKWPFCESFVPTVLKQAGQRFGKISEFADTSNLRYRPRILIDDERANRPGSLAHSVLTLPAYIAAVIREGVPRDYFSTTHPMALQLRARALEDYALPLRRAFEQAHDHFGLQEFIREMAKQGMSVFETDDLAYGKPALASSTSEWSRSPDLLIDAVRANGSKLADDYAFHTARELNPWWMVDLTDNFVIDEVAITNRQTCADRFTCFMIQSSLDGGAWINRHMKLDLKQVSANPKHPHVVVFGEPFIARYVRISLLGTEALHLRRVQVFGRRILPRLKAT